MRHFKKVNQNISKEELIKLIEQGIVYVCIEESNEYIVRSMIKEILDKDRIDEHKITDVLLDDHGNCIHITFTGESVSTSIILEIGNVFGDDDPLVFAQDADVFKVVVINNKYDFE